MLFFYVGILWGKGTAFFGKSKAPNTNRKAKRIMTILDLYPIQEVVQFFS